MTSLLLPTPGDPLVIEQCFRNIETFKHLFDEIIILINNIVTPHQDTRMQKELDEFYNSLNEKYGFTIKIHHHVEGGKHGKALELLTEMCEGDIIMYHEDDHYILDVNELENRLNLVKSGKKSIVGIDRNFCDNNIIETFFKRYPERKTSCVGWWPSYFIFKKDLYYKTDRYLSDKTLTPETDPDYCTEKSVGDTMNYFSLQLHDLVNFEDIANYYSPRLGRFNLGVYSHPDYQVNDNSYLYENNFKDIHFGGLSVMFDKVFYSDINWFDELLNNSDSDFVRRIVPEYLDNINPDPIINDTENDYLKLDFLKNYVWMLVLAKHTSLDKFKENYIININKVLDKYYSKFDYVQIEKTLTDIYNFIKKNELRV